MRKIARVPFFPSCSPRGARTRLCVFIKREFQTRNNGSHLIYYRVSIERKPVHNILRPYYEEDILLLLCNNTDKVCSVPDDRTFVNLSRVSSTRLIDACTPSHYDSPNLTRNGPSQYSRLKRVDRCPKMLIPRNRKAC